MRLQHGEMHEDIADVGIVGDEESEAARDVEPFERAGENAIGRRFRLAPRSGASSSQSSQAEYTGCRSLRMLNIPPPTCYHGTRIGQKRQIKQCHSGTSISSPGAIETIRRDSVKSCPPRIIAAICFSRSGRSATRSANGPIRRLRAKASAASMRARVDCGRQRRGILLADADLAERAGDASLAQAPARHRRGPGLPERAIVDITELDHFLGQRCRIRRLPFPAAFADLARQICRQSRSSSSRTARRSAAPSVRAPLCRAAACAGREMSCQCACAIIVPQSERILNAWLRLRVLALNMSGIGENAVIKGARADGK